MKYLAQLGGVVVFAGIAGGLDGWYNYANDSALIKYAVLFPMAILGYWLGGKLYDRFSKGDVG